jgi:thiol-disulfide isomerase/thioredoxin
MDGNTRRRGKCVWRRALAVLSLLAAVDTGCLSRRGEPPGVETTTKVSAEQAPVAEAVTAIAPIDPERVFAVLINGGGRPEINYQSHLIHLKQLIELLRQSGVDPGRIAVFSGDGPDPAPDLATREINREPRSWLLPRGPVRNYLSPEIEYVNSTIDGFTLRPARKQDLTAWFSEEGRRLIPGDTLLFYVTDHGEKNNKDLSNNTITLWKENLNVDELREMLALLNREVRTVMVMSQCFSGAFARAMYGDGGEAQPDGNVCGYFSVTADRPAYGCYPENRGKDGIGYSHRLFEALDVLGTLPEAHRRVQVTDNSPDVPFKTTNKYLEDLLHRAAERSGRDPTAFIDDLLAEAWRNRKAWEPQIRLLDRIGHTFGTFSPRSLHELQEESQALPELSKQLRTYGQRWSEALEALKVENWNEFLAAHASWGDRVDPKKQPRLDGPARQALLTELLDQLEPFTKANPARHERLLSLKEKADEASGAAYRTDVRLGAVLRMQAILTSIAGRVYLARDAAPEERDAFARLEGCESLPLGPPPRVASAALLETPDPFPTLATERDLVQRVAPAWMGIQYRPLPERQREQHRMEKGAVAVTTVFPDSAAAKAGLQVGDIILGPPEAPFTEPHAVREWTMRSEVGAPAPLRIWRDQDLLQLSLRPDPFPIKMPKLPGPPPVGSTAPPLKVELYRGTQQLVEGKSRLLFFWATWCAPCKFALPEVLAFAKARGVEVLAITDEDSGVLEEFFRDLRDPFPSLVATDPLRLTFQSYGVSGTPTFVLVDAARVVRHYQTGYTQAGLTIDGWEWTRKKAAATGPKKGS